MIWDLISDTSHTIPYLVQESTLLPHYVPTSENPSKVSHITCANLSLFSPKARPLRSHLSPLHPFCPSLFRAQRMLLQSAPRIPDTGEMWGGRGLLGWQRVFESISAQRDLAYVGFV